MFQWMSLLISLHHKRTSFADDSVSSKSIRWWVWWQVCITSKPVSLMILCSSESIRWWICVTREPVSLMNFCGRLHIRTGSMSKMIALYDCNIWTLECEHVCSWNWYDYELCDYRMQMYWFVTIDMLGGATKDRIHDRTRTSHRRSR